MARQKRTADLKIYVPPALEQRLLQLAERERRPLSTYCYEILEEHVSLTIFKQTLRGDTPGN